MRRDAFIAVLVGLVVIGLWAASGLALYSSHDRGTFGDMFGAFPLHLHLTTAVMSHWRSL